MKATSPVKIAPREFVAGDFIGGDPALDFVNTVTGRDQTPLDRLDGYARLLKWAGLVELLPKKNLRALAAKARAEPGAAADAMERAKALREALFGLLTAIIAGRSAPKGALAVLRRHWVAGVNAHELRLVDRSVVPVLRSDAAELDLVASMVAYRMVEHVLTLPTERLRICQGPNCAWLFADTSKAGRRRWCDMAVCGNAAKSRRFYARSVKRRRSTGA